MAATTRLQTLSVSCGLRLNPLFPRSRAGRPFSASHRSFTTSHNPLPPRANDEVARLAASRRRPLTLADLLK
jgi:hypothetical protein